MTRARWLWLPAALVALAVVSYMAYQTLRPTELPTGFLYVNGHVEGTEVTLSAEVAGRVVAAEFEEGRTVDSGQILVRIDPADYRARLAQAQAERRATAAEREMLIARLETARHHLQTAEADLEALRQAFEQAAAAQKELREDEDRVREARSEVGILEAQVDRLEARLDAADQQIELLRLQLERTEIAAPLDATVLIKAVEAGELVQPARVVAVLADLSRVELKAYVPEREIGKIKLGDEARVRIDAFPDRLFDATVARVDQQAQFTPRDIHMPEERTRMVFGVTLALENDDGLLKPGMPADAWIKWDHETPWPAQLTIPR